MSPRSEEFMAQARERLEGAQHSLGAGHLAIAASAGYYAMLYAARAALSERDLYAKTHSGTWTLFSEQFVNSGEFDPELSAKATSAQHTREQGDYEARPPSSDQAEEVVRDASLFIAEVERVLGA